MQVFLKISVGQKVVGQTSWLAHWEQKVGGRVWPKSGPVADYKNCSTVYLHSTPGVAIACLACTSLESGTVIMLSK